MTEKVRAYKTPEFYIAGMIATLIHLIISLSLGLEFLVLFWLYCMFPAMILIGLFEKVRVR